MSPFTKIGEFEYWTHLLQALRTSDDFDKSIAEYREKRQGWSAYLAGRRVGEYLEFARLQRMQIHGTALVADDDPVCSCLLVARLDVPAAPNHDHILFANPGHLDYSNGQLVTAFYIRHQSEETQAWPLHFFCQICSALEIADLTGDERLDRLLLEDFRKTHCHEIEID